MKKDRLDETLSRYLHAPGTVPRKLSEASRTRILEAVVEASGETEDSSHRFAVRPAGRRLLLAAGLASLLVIAIFLVWPSEEVIRTGERGTEVVLADGSHVEMGSHSELSLKDADDGIRIHLITGDVLFNAAKQRPGRHLYVRTRDATVSVVGTVFLVKAEKEGSRIAVIEGEVRVQQGGSTTTLRPGYQLSTNPQMEPRTLNEELSFSRQAVTHTALLQQTSPGLTTPPTPKLQFEVASLKRVNRADIEDGKFGPRPLEIRCKGVDETWSSSNRADSVNLAVQGRCLGILFLGQLIGFAFDLPNERVSGTIPYEPYQLDAKAENPATVTRAELVEMLRNLVIDRFKLKTHTEVREAQGYALRVAESGLKIKETSLGEEGTTWTKREQPGCVFYCWDGRFRMKKFAYGLGNMTNTKPIADLTGLNGVYQFRFTLNRVDAVADAPGAAPRGANGPGDPPKAVFDPPLAKALEQQLGLRLDEGKVPVEYIVVDSLERPEQN